MTGLRLENLSYAYGARQALDAVSFRVEPGTFCALLGPNGAGKSTLFALLTRLFTAPQGRIEIDGHDMARAPRKALRRMGVVFQQPTLDLDLTVQRNLSYFAALHGLHGARAQARIEAALERLEMPGRLGERVRDLNGGHRRRLEIARSLIHHPKVLLLDEPTVGLDAATRRAITAHVHDLSRRKGLTVLWATHLTDEIEDADQLLILHRGKLAQDGKARQLRGGLGLADHFLRLTGEPA
ncbi:ATP-binding cassette domain-containing protein [Leisingera aquaemixtae]|uniref:ABC transporter ATP-binding protein n=1 Tax=Leisingera aquaemixtae TaxID=1396826 RepID=UPI001C95FC44|nr:ABC transporter ATP-binding protein [Leisingera aquaemixtae]MBY6068905.1 ATP-binding cassette domain-containing protein [Leisingera aquaemixtae]